MTSAQAAAQPPASGVSVSAPGKVLLTGGYLVLDPRFSGLVVATDARFVVHVAAESESDAAAAAAAAGTSEGGVRVRVRSPQFIDGAWDRTIALPGSRVAGVPPHAAGNVFVDTALECVFAVLERRMGPAALAAAAGPCGLRITVNADNDFYSQTDDLDRRGLPHTADALASLPQFNATHTRIADVKKTGLGSSAAMTTSLCAALLVFFGAVEPAAMSVLVRDAGADVDAAIAAAHRAQLDLVYRIAQISHCLAQRNSGSGFDVSSAAVGSHEYTRYDPVVLDSLVRTIKETGQIDADALYEAVERGTWTQRITPFKMPPGLSLMLGDVSVGTNTVKFVSKVLRWRAEEPELGEFLWQQLNRANTRAVTALKRLNALHAADAVEYAASLELFAAVPASHWAAAIPRTASIDGAGADAALRDLVNERLAALASGDKAANIDQGEALRLAALAHDASKPTLACLVDTLGIFGDIRSLLRVVSDRAQVPITPPEQLRLIDACHDVAGLLAAGIPGAGGYDAIFCIVVSDEAKRGVQRVWSAWTETAVMPLLQNEAKFGLHAEIHG
ncbi:phosphomevalonate kinase [Polyrhizophydium stewartii]|uniref:Phosphomevalonate kinase n=1 Tax=Polyrhizophydium stewartii TaxID=2732419 RepID=A0ABR4MWH6_9FUNG|nr:phosphomevalonate kinase [Polyrhizophydium stewartii]